MKNRTTKPFEIIYITAIVSPTNEGDTLTFLALDDYSKFLHPPVLRSVSGDDLEFIETLTQFLNGINSTYNRTIHSQSTTYCIDLPEAFHPLLSSMILSDDKLVYEPNRVKKNFKPVLDKLFSFKP